MTSAGMAPSTTQTAAATSMPPVEKPSASRAADAAALRDRPRNVMPISRMNTAAATAAASAKPAPAAGTMSFRNQPGRAGLASTAWNSSHSDTKPFSGGSAAIASAAISMAAVVRGMRRARPP